MVNYAKQDYNKEHMARASFLGIPVSFKQAVELCSYIRGRSVKRAKTILTQVIAKKQPVPYRRYKKDIPHKTKIGVGRYPVKAATNMLDLIESAEANAQFKGLNTSDMVVSHLCANKSQKAWHHGRKRGLKMKRTNIEIVLEEKSKEDKAPSKDAKNTDKKGEDKK